MKALGHPGLVAGRATQKALEYPNLVAGAKKVKEANAANTEARYKTCLGSQKPSKKTAKRYA